MYSQDNQESETTMRVHVREVENVHVLTLGNPQLGACQQLGVRPDLELANPWSLSGTRGLCAHNMTHSYTWTGIVVCCRVI